MELHNDVADDDRLIRAALAVGLLIVAISSLRKGKRLSGALAGAGALAVGYTAASGGASVTAGLSGAPETEAPSEADATEADVKLRCAICGQPILPGQRRGPDAGGEPVHVSCRDATE